MRACVRVCKRKRQPVAPRPSSESEKSPRKFFFALFMCLKLFKNRIQGLIRCSSFIASLPERISQTVAFQAAESKFVHVKCLKLILKLHLPTLLGPQLITEIVVGLFYIWRKVHRFSRVRLIQIAAGVFKAFSRACCGLLAACKASLDVGQDGEDVNQAKIKPKV